MLPIISRLYSNKELALELLKKKHPTGSDPANSATREMVWLEVFLARKNVDSPDDDDPNRLTV